MTVFHIASRDSWLRDQTDDLYRPSSLHDEGFIHFSTDRQLLASAQRFFEGHTDLVVISVREDRLRAELRYEEVDGQLFPHLHGPLNLDAVVEVVELPPADANGFDVPREWQPWARYFR